MCKQELESLRVSIIECYDENRDGKIEVSEMTKFLPVEDNFLLYFRSDCCLSDLGPSDEILKVDLKGGGGGGVGVHPDFFVKLGFEIEVD